MAWETGSATDEDDLLDKLITFLTTDATLVGLGQEWTVMKDEEPASDRFVYFRGPGLAGNDQIHVNIRRYYSAAGGSYNWEIRGATSYDGGLAFDAQPNTSHESFFALSPGTMTYWFFANGRRFIVIAKIGTVFTSMYGGFFLPYALPSEYPYPMFIGATSYLEYINYSTAGILTSASWKMGYMPSITTPQSGVKIRTPGGYWLHIGQGTPSGVSATLVARLWPYWSQSISANTDLGQCDLTKNPDNTYTLLPVIIYSDVYDTKDVYGELDGVFHVPGTDLNSEDTITILADVYLAFQNVDDVARNDFAAILRA